MGFFIFLVADLYSFSASPVTADDVGLSLTGDGEHFDIRCMH